jgi:thioredoxin 1
MLRVAFLLGFLAAARADVEEITTEPAFKKALANNAAVVVDFFSQTCGPCIMIAPKFKELAKEYEGRVKFIKVDVQRSYVGVQVRSMPTFHFYVHVRRRQLRRRSPDPLAHAPRARARSLARRASSRSSSRAPTRMACA